MSKITRETRGLLYQLYKLMHKRELEPAEGITLDVVIPVLEKDLRVLPLCLEGVRKCVNHTLGKIYIVSPPSETIRNFCREYGTEFVDENTVLGYSARDINFVTDAGIDRSGWIFQQLVKLSGALGQNRYYLVIDADHVLLNPHTFIARDGRLVFYRSSEYHVPYYNNIEVLTGYCDYGFFTFSYVTHKMIFDKELLADLRKILEEKSGKRWDKAIVESQDSGEMSPFSEFELYGNFVPDERKVSLPWRTKSMSYARLDAYDKLQAKYGRRYLAVTFPDYYNR